MRNPLFWIHVNIWSGTGQHRVRNRSTSGQEQIRKESRLDPDDSMRNPLFWIHVNIGSGTGQERIQVRSR